MPADPRLCHLPPPPPHSTNVAQSHALIAFAGHDAPCRPGPELIFFFFPGGFREIKLPGNMFSGPSYHSISGRHHISNDDGPAGAEMVICIRPPAAWFVRVPVRHAIAFYGPSLVNQDNAVHKSFVKGRLLQLGAPHFDPNNPVERPRSGARFLPTVQASSAACHDCAFRRKELRAACATPHAGYRCAAASVADQKGTPRGLVGARRDLGGAA